MLWAPLVAPLEARSEDSMEPTIRGNEPGPASAMPPALLEGPAVLRGARVQARAERLEAPAEEAARPPRWAVRVVKGCVAGILVLPVAAPALLAASDSFLGAHAETFRMIGSPVAVALWIGLLLAAHALIGRFPPVERR